MHKDYVGIRTPYSRCRSCSCEHESRHAWPTIHMEVLFVDGPSLKNLRVVVLQAKASLSSLHCNYVIQKVFFEMFVCDVLYADCRFCQGRASRGEFASRPMWCRTSPFARIATFSIFTYSFLSSKPWTALEARTGSGDAAQGLIGTQGTKGGDRQHCKRLGRVA